MSYRAADGAALVAAAVRAAIEAKAPRRTVAAVAAAVSGTVVSAATRAASPDIVAKESAKIQGGDGDAAELLSSLRAVRAAQRKRKKERKKAAKHEAAALDVRVVDGTADANLGSGEPVVAASALVPSEQFEVGTHALAPPPPTATNEAIRDVATGAVANEPGSLVESSIALTRGWDSAPSFSDATSHRTDEDASHHSAVENRPSLAYPRSSPYPAAAPASKGLRKGGKKGGGRGKSIDWSQPGLPFN